MTIFEDNEARRADLSFWRDAVLHKRHGDEMAAFRLAKQGVLDDVVERYLALDPQPTEDELGWCDIEGWPINPRHGTWGYGAVKPLIGLHDKLWSPNASGKAK